MFTIEMDWDETAITILDETGQYEDLQVVLYDDICYIRQWDHDLGRHHYVVVSPEQILALQSSFTLPVGAYTMAKNNGEKE